MRYARWASLFVGLGLVCACGTSSGQTRPPDEGKQETTASALTEFVSPGERLTSAAIVLQDDSEGACVKADPVAPIYTKKGRTVRWVIVNNCTATVRIQLQFAPPPGGFYPFSNLLDSCSAAPGHMCTPIPMAVVKRTGPPESPRVVVYPYSIIANGHPLDPEVVVEWF